MLPINILKSNQHSVRFFDATFYSKWTFNETANTNNKQYRPTEYLNDIKFNDNDLIDDFVKLCTEFEPDIIFWSAISSLFMERESMSIFNMDMI